jgi:hypothetical protein
LNLFKPRNSWALILVTTVLLLPTMGLESYFPSQVGQGCGCVRPADYWKEHLDAWPPGPDYSDFFGSGMSWERVLDTPRRGGDVYFPLAQAYIVAMLNKNSNACFPCDDLCTLTGITEYFFTHPNYSLAMNGWSYYRTVADTFEAYDNGQRPEALICE